MNVGELKKYLQNIPDDVTVCIEDMSYFTEYNFEVGQYNDGQAYIDLIMPVHVSSYFNDGSEVQRVLL